MPQQHSDYPLDYSKTSKASDSDTSGRTQGQAKTAAESAQEMADRVTRQAAEYGEKAREAVQQFKPYAEKSMKEQPMATLAGAAVLGFVLGALWKR